MNTKIAPQRWFRLIPVAFITYSLAYLDTGQLWFCRSRGDGK